MCAPSQQNPSLWDVVGMEQLGSDQAMEEKVLESCKHKDVQFRKSWKLEPKEDLMTMSLHSDPALVTPLGSRWDTGAVKPSGWSLRALIGTLAVFPWEATCLCAQLGLCTRRMFGCRC